MTHYTQYLKHHVDLLKEFKSACIHLPPFRCSNDALDTTDDEETAEWLSTLDQLCQMSEYNEQTNEKGQWWVGRVVSTYSHLMPFLHRDILWFFGGNCLHYMPDEEILFYQQLDELRFSAEEAGHAFDYSAAKQSLSQPH